MDKLQDTVESLRSLVVDGESAGQGRLPTERELCEMMGVGRRRLRRALHALESDGLIVRQQGRGTFIAAAASVEPPRSQGHARDASQDGRARSLSHHSSPVEQIELKLTLEPVMARLAATRASRADIERLLQAAADTKAATSAEAYQEADRAFHGLIAELSRNSLFQALHEDVSEALRDAALDRFGDQGHCFKRQATHTAFHQQIATAIANRDGDEAARHMHAHLRDVHQSLLLESLAATYGSGNLN